VTRFTVRNKKGERSETLTAPQDKERGMLLYDKNTYVPFDNYPDVLTVEQLQNALEIGRSTAYKLVRSGDIGYIRIGSSIRIPKTALINYLQSNLNSCYNEPSSGQAIQAVGKESVVYDSKP
jgi:hypothetical protein